MKNIEIINDIQMKCEIIARKSEVVKLYDLAVTYGDVSQTTVDKYEKEYNEKLIDLKNKIEEYLSDCQN